MTCSHCTTSGAKAGTEAKTAVKNGAKADRAAAADRAAKSATSTGTEPQGAAGPRPRTTPKCSDAPASLPGGRRDHAAGRGAPSRMRHRARTASARTDMACAARTAGSPASSSSAMVRPSGTSNLTASGVVPMRRTPRLSWHAAITA